MTYPRTFSHIGISVTDLNLAVEFYTQTLGWYVIMPPTEIVSDDSAIGVMCNDVFGKGWGRFRIAHLATGDRVGVELFEFENAERPENNFEYWKSGVFHFCVQDPDVEGLAKRMWKMEESRECRCASTTPVKSPTGWFTARIHLGT